MYIIIQQFSVALACRKNVLMTQFLFTILAAVFKNICRDVENKRKIDLNQWTTETGKLPIPKIQYGLLIEPKLQLVRFSNSISVLSPKNGPPKQLLSILLHFCKLMCEIWEISMTFWLIKRLKKIFHNFKNVWKFEWFTLFCSI